MMNPAPYFLLVEDNSCIRQSICHLLEEYPGGDIVCHANGEKALAEICSRPPDLLLLNHRLGGKMMGSELIFRVRVRYHFPILLISGERMASCLPQSWGLPAFSVLPKPFLPFQLKKVVDSLLKIR